VDCGSILWFLDSLDGDSTVLLSTLGEVVLELSTLWKARRGEIEGRPWRGVQVCIIGAGKMSKLLVKHLVSKGCEKMTILNRSLPRAEDLAAEFSEVSGMLPPLGGRGGFNPIAVFLGVMCLYAALFI
jgi:Shikimate / quinate 5-dehydrogenase